MYAKAPPAMHARTRTHNTKQLSGLLATDPWGAPADSRAFGAPLDYQALVFNPPRSRA